MMSCGRKREKHALPLLFAAIPDTIPTMQRNPQYFFLLFFCWQFAGLAGCTVDAVIDDQAGAPDTSGNTGDSATQPADSASESEITCTTVSSDGGSASTAVDFILAVDNSAGMEEEILMLQTELPRFVTSLQQQGLDIQLTLITGPAPDADDKKKNGICIPDPPGSGACPEDSNLPVYLHIPESIASKDALTRIHATAPTWLPRLRTDSAVHLMVISDDDADMEANRFIEEMAALSPGVTSFIFHTISASTDKAPACEADPPLACCETAAKAGSVYQSLSQQTGGISFDLCEQNFRSAFDQVQTVVFSSRCVNGSPVE